MCRTAPSLCPAQGRLGAPQLRAARPRSLDPPVALGAIDEIYIFARQDTGIFRTEIERGWNVSLVSLNGTELWTYDWPAGTSALPAVWRRATWPPPPPPLTPSPPAVQRENSPCEQAHATPAPAASGSEDAAAG
jgi:hypothetical protein